jgi:pimeloyl-ACP methyl ester carboxylesterase
MAVTAGRGSLAGTRGGTRSDSMGAEMESATASSHGIPIAYEVRGTGSPALLFVHGWSCDRTHWKHQIEEFEHRHEVVAIDLPGHGQSGPGRPVATMSAFAGDVTAVVEERGLRQVILILVDTYRQLGDERSPEQVERIVGPLRADFASGARDFVRGMFSPATAQDLIEWVLDGIAAAPPETALSALEHALMFEPAVVEALKEIRVPVFAINPDQGGDVESLRLHGVSTVLMSGVGHFGMLEDPATFNRLLGEIIREIAASPARPGG